MLSYTRSHYQGRLQKLLAIYFKFCGLTAKGFDTLHALALTMSHKWTCDAVAQISREAMQEVTKLIDLFPWLLTYNNVNILFRVFSQHLDNQSEFGNGTAATVYIKRSAIPLPPTANRNLQETRSAGLRNPLTALKIMDLAHASFPRIKMQMKYQVLGFLLNSPEFDLSSYKGKGGPLLQPPNPVHQLPHGRDHITLQYLLGTVNIPEASYEDNSWLIKEWLHQLSLDAKEKQKMLGLEEVIAWVGDQLTIDRLQNLFKF
jgi:hypothetical protein